MAFKLLITHHAEQDIDAAIEWYNQISKSLSQRFIEELYSVLGIIVSNPEIFRIRHKQLRLVNMDIFPYQVIYRINNNAIEVIAVFHSKRHSRVWKKRNKT